MVARDAATHGGNFRHSGHHIHLANVAVAHLALNARFEMGPVAPKYPSRHRVDAHPWHRFLRRGVLSQLLNRGMVAVDGLMAGRATVDIREGHVIPGIGILVAELTFELNGGVLFVAEGNRLYRRSVLRW
jgi:hypothetical protein